MNKAIKLISLSAVALTMCIACGKGDPRRKGIEAGKAACECYQLEGFESVDKCLKEIEKEYIEYQYDTAFINAMEQQMLEGVANGVMDISKPIKEVAKPAADSTKSKE